MKEMNIVRIKSQELCDDLDDQVEVLRAFSEKYGKDINIYDLLSELKKFISLYDQYMISEDIKDGILDNDYGELVWYNDHWKVFESKEEKEERIKKDLKKKGYSREDLDCYIEEHYKPEER